MVNKKIRWRRRNGQIEIGLWGEGKRKIIKQVNLKKERKRTRLQEERETACGEKETQEMTNDSRKKDRKNSKEGRKKERMKGRKMPERDMMFAVFFYHASDCCLNLDVRVCTFLAF